LRLEAALLLGAAAVMAGCETSSTAATHSRPAPSPSAAAASPTSDPCGAGPAQTAGAPGKSVYRPDAGYATALAWSPDGRLFYTRREGIVMVVQAGGPHQFADVSAQVSTAGERGLLGLALSPGFAKDRMVYVFYSRSDDVTKQRVVRWTDCAGTGQQPTTVIDDLPASPPGNPNDCCHKGGRLAFGPDGKLYVTLGENHLSSAAQDKTSLRGKILRYNPDGSVPADNPFGNPVWAIGLRNPFGIAFGPDGTLLVTNNGPSGDAGSPGTGYDMVDIITRGGNYQWPLCYGYSHQLSGSCPAGSTEPAWSSETQTLVPTGATYVGLGGPHAAAGHFVFCSYRDGVMRIYLGPRNVVTGESGCSLDVKEGPDHALYFSNGSQILRLS
jgi:glucose/arabinose dehydrogenase